MVAPGEAGPQVNGRAAAPEQGHRLGAERIAALLAVAGAANLALRVVEEAARSAREDLESVLRSVDAIEQQKRAARGAAHALDESAARAAQHLRTVDRLTEAASRGWGRHWPGAAPTPARPPWNSSTHGRT